MDMHRCSKLISDLEHLNKDLARVEAQCDKCIIRKVVYAVVAFIGLAFLSAVVALVVKAGAN